MRKVFIIAAMLALSASLSGCFVLAVGAAGAGAGYIYKEQENRGRVP